MINYIETHKEINWFESYKKGKLMYLISREINIKPGYIMNIITDLIKENIISNNNPMESEEIITRDEEKELFG